MKINRDIFFEAIRSYPFPGRFTQSQVDGLNRLLDVWEEHYAPLIGDDQASGDWSWLELDYNLATSFHETGTAMQPVSEQGDLTYFLKYDPMGNPRKANELGNTTPGDGFTFRGAGDVQNTGRGNAIKSGQRLSAFLEKPIDFVADPDLRLDPVYSAHCLFLGNHEGWWTGVGLPQALSDNSGEGVGEWKRERSVVNGTDRWREIAEYAIAFGKARMAATRAPNPTLVVRDPVSTVEQQLPQGQSSVIADAATDAQLKQSNADWTSKIHALAVAIKKEDLPVQINITVTVPISPNLQNPTNPSTT